VIRRPGRTTGELITLTAAKTVSNTALRWVGPFLPTLERAFSSSTGTLTGIMGVAELGGLNTLVTGPALDRGHERTIYAAGLGLVAVSSVIALAGTVTAFAISFVLLIVGVGNLTAAGHAWIGHRVPFSSRNRAIGAYEMSWAVALLVGAPMLSMLIEWYGWRGPYVALAVGSMLAAALVLVRVRPGVVHTATTPNATANGGTHRARLPAPAYLPMVASASIAASGIGIFVISGAWLEDRHDLSTGGLGLVAAMFGAVELFASGAVASVADRIGSRRSVAGGLLVLGAGVVTMALSGESAALAVAGLAVFLLGFEYAFVSSLTMVTEAAPASRGKAIGVSNSIGTLARSGSVVLTGQLYEQFGIAGSLTMVTVTGTAALTLTLLGSRPTPIR
jgi:DHA1 family inner membrane transport protein